MDENDKEEICKQVKQFLIEIKNLIYQDCLYIKNRTVNKDTLLELGLTPKQREEIVLNLSIMDYCSGPHLDSLKPGVYWIFGKKIGNTEVYIKNYQAIWRRTSFLFILPQSRKTIKLSII